MVKQPEECSCRVQASRTYITEQSRVEIGAESSRAKDQPMCYILDLVLGARVTAVSKTEKNPTLQEHTSREERWTIKKQA